MTERERNFPDLLARLKPECDGIIAQYEHKRSALLASHASISEARRLREPRRDRCGGADCSTSRLPRSRRRVSFYTLLYPRPVGKYVLQVCRGLACSDQRRRRHHGVFSRKTRRRPFADDAGRNVLVRRGRMSGCLRSCDVHAGQSRVRLRSDAAEDRRDARVDPRRNVTRSRRWRRPTSRDRRGRSPRTTKFRWARKSPGRARRSAARTTPAASAITSGVIMLDRFVNNQVYQFTGTTRTRGRGFARRGRHRRRRERACRSLKF